MKNADNFSPVEVKAIAQLISDDAAAKASSAIPAGEHAIDMTLKVTGVLTKGDDYSQEIVEKADPWTLLSVALSHLNGITIESITREAMTADPAMVDSIKVAAKKAVETVKGPTMTPCNGKVRVKLTAVRV